MFWYVRVHKALFSHGRGNKFLSEKNELVIESKKELLKRDNSMNHTKQNLHIIHKKQEISSSASTAWPIWMSNPEIECISGTPIVSCQTLASTLGPLLNVLDLDEAAAMQAQQPMPWMSGPVGPSFVNSNGDMIVCQEQKVYGSAGCGSSEVQAQRACPTHAPQKVDYIVVITQYWGEGYFHMVVEGLTRLAQAKHEHPEFFEAPRIVHVHTPSLQTEQILKLMGLSQVISGDVLVTHALLAAPPTPCGGHRRSPHARWLRSLLTLGLPIPVQSKQPLVVRRTGSRSILNHDALVASLGARVHVGNEPIVEQLQLFAESQLVVGPHGAGLANIVVMRSGSRVVELQTAPANHCYLLWAFNLDLMYYGYYEAGATHGGSWTLNIDRLLALPAFENTF